MNSFSLFLISYVLTYSGFILANATKEEFKELLSIVTKIKEVYLLAIYTCFLFVFTQLHEMLIITFSFLLFAIGKVFKEEFLELHNILFFIATFVIALNSPNYYYLATLPIVYLIIDNSFKNFNLKEKIYEFISIIILFLVINFIF